FVLLRAPPSSQPFVSRSLVQRAPAYSTRLSPYSSACATHQVAISQPRLRLVTAVLPSARLSARSALAFSGRGGAACLPPSGPAACGSPSTGYQQCRARGTRPVNAAARI